MIICSSIISSQMPCLEQTSAIMILHISLSSVIRSKAMLSLLFPVTKELKLSRNVILCLLLLLVPSILPVRDTNSSPLWRHMCLKNFSCLFFIVFMVAMNITGMGYVTHDRNDGWAGTDYLVHAGGCMGGLFYGLAFFPRAPT